jgi:hypothetical protein
MNQPRRRAGRGLDAHVRESCAKVIVEIDRPEPSLSGLKTP